MTEEKNGLSRRTVVKGAAWSVPVIAAAVATPLAAASVGGANVVWGASNTTLLEIGLLNGAGSGGGLVTTNVLPTGPTNFTINNTTPGALVGPLRGVVTIAYASGLPLLSVKGYGVYAVNGDPAAVTNRVETVHVVTPLVANTYDTTQDIAIAGAVNGEDSLTVPLTFGLTNGGGLGASVLVSYTASLSVFDANNVQVGSTVTSTLVTPVGLNIL